MAMAFTDKVWKMQLPLCCNKGVVDWFTGAEPWQIQRYRDLGFQIWELIQITSLTPQVHHRGDCYGFNTFHP